MTVATPQAPVRRILVVRLSAIGDLVMATPVLDSLKRLYPEARISWLVQSEMAPLLRYDPRVDELVVWPRHEWQALWRQRRWRALWREIRSLRRRLRQARYDLALDLQGLLKSGLLAWLSGAPQRIGLGSREGSGLLMTRVVARAGDPDLISSEYQYLMQQLGDRRDDFAMSLQIAEQDRAFARDLLERKLGDASSGYIVLCPFTTRPQKHWPEKSWSQLLRLLRQESGLPLLLLGAPADRPAAERILRSPIDGVHDLVGATGLMQAAALVSEARLLIGVDTGLSHMGIAFQRSCLLLFGSTCPYLDTRSSRARVIYQGLSCAPCKRRPLCHGRFDCMASIEVEEVVLRGLELLEGA